jgi:hypothetical protein
MSTEQIIVNDVAIQTSVAPIEVTPVEVAVKQTKEKKPKKVSDSPKLAPKFQKYLYFGYWVALQLKNKNLINDEVFQTILTDIKMNDEVGLQTEFYTNYENVEFKMVSRKPTVSPDAPSLTADGLEVKPKAKKARKPKVVATEAVPVEGLVEGVAEGLPVEKPKAKRVRKPKVVTSHATSDAAETAVVETVPVEGGPVEDKPKAKKYRKVVKPTGRDSTPTTPSLPEEGVVEGVPVEEKSTKKARKPKVIPSDATETAVVEAVQDKPKTKKPRKTNTTKSDDIIHDLLSHATSFDE